MKLLLTFLLLARAPFLNDGWSKQWRLKLLLTFLLLPRAMAAEIVTNLPSAGGEQWRLKLLLTFLLPAVNVMRISLCCDGKSEGRRSSLMAQSLNSGREDYDKSSVDNRTDTDDRLAG